MRALNGDNNSEVQLRLASQLRISVSSGSLYAVFSVIDMASSSQPITWSSFFSSKSSSYATLSAQPLTGGKPLVKASNHPEETVKKHCRRLLRNPTLPLKLTQKQWKVVRSVEAQLDDIEAEQPNSKPIIRKLGNKQCFAVIKGRSTKPMQQPAIPHSLEVSLKKMQLNERFVRLKPRYRSISAVLQDQSKDSIHSNEENYKAMKSGLISTKKTQNKDAVEQNIERLVQQQAHKRTSSLLRFHPIKRINIHFLLRQSEARKAILKSPDPCDPQNLRLPMNL